MTTGFITRMIENFLNLPEEKNKIGHDRDRRLLLDFVLFLKQNEKKQRKSPKHIVYQIERKVDSHDGTITLSISRMTNRSSIRPASAPTISAASGTHV